MVLTCVVLLAAGVVQGAVGFGSGLVAVGLLAAAFGIKNGSVIFCMPALCLCLTMLIRLRKHFTFRRVWPVFLGVAAGVPLGVRFFDWANPRWLEGLLAALMIVTVVYNLVPHLARRRWHPVLVGLPVGVFGGVLGGALSTSGPAAVAYVSTQRFGRLRFAACLQGLFVTSTSLRLLELVRTGLLTRERLLFSAVGVAPVLLGSVIGMWVLHRVSEKVFRWLVIIVLAVLAARYLIKAALAA